MVKWRKSINVLTVGRSLTLTRSLRDIKGFIQKKRRINKIDFIPDLIF